MIYITITKPKVTILETAAYLREIADKLEAGETADPDLDWYLEEEK